MNAKVKKIVKILAWIVGIIILIPILLIATLPLWLGPIARPIVNSAAPGYTGTSFNIGHLSLNPYTGRLELGDFVLGNPEGYSEPTAVAVSNLVVDVAMTTLNDKYVHVEEITVDGVFVSYLKGGEHDVPNFTQIQFNLAGGKEKYEENKARSQELAAADEAKVEAEAAELQKKLDAMSDEERAEYDRQQAEAELAAKKFIIDHVLISNVKIKYGFLTIPIPVDIELTDLGKESDGLTLSEFFDAIWQAILKSAMAAGDGAKALGGLISGGAEILGDGAGKAVDALGDGAGKAVDAIKGLFK